jgi:alkylation response protein AidB-like acyl-CoA dehydrogenase
MNFDFSEEQYSFRDSLRGFLADHLDSPTRASDPIDDSQRLWAGLADLGILAILVPERYDGLGLTFVDTSLVLEELGRHLASPAIIDTMVATDAIVRYGSAELKAALLPRIAKGQARIAIAVHEAAAGCELRDMSTASSRQADRLKLRGDKILVCDATSADFLLIVEGATEACGPQLVLVDRNSAGVELRKQTTLDLTADYYQIALREVPLEDAYLIRTGSAGSSAAKRLLDASALAAAAQMTGIGGSVLDKAVEYVKQRVQFGRPIGSFQAIKHRCADMAVAVDSSRSAVYYAAWALANEAPECPKAVSIAKSYSGDMSRFVCSEGIQLHGGMGFTWALGLHLYLRRAKLLESSYGDSTYHRERVLAETLAELSAARR